MAEQLAPPKNGMYYTPEEIRERVNASVKTSGGGGQNWYTDRISEGLSIDPNTGEVKRQGVAYWDQFNPFTRQNEEAVEKIARGKKARQEAETIRQKVAGAPLEQLKKAKAEQIGDGLITVDNVDSLVNEATIRRQQKPTPQQRAITEEATNARIDANNILRQQLLAQVSNNNKTYQLALLQAAEASEARADNLEYQRSRDRREDIRYNEQMERLDRKDRMTAMQNIAAGLASLGAAFAV